MLRRVVRVFDEKGGTYFIRLIYSIVRSRYMVKKYGYGGGLKLSESAYISGRRDIIIGKDVTIGKRSRIEAISRHGERRYIPHLSIGKGTAINDDVHIACISRVSIGEDVLMASRIYISDHNHGIYNGSNPDSPYNPPNNRPLSIQPVHIGSKVWLGEGVCVLPGVSIGDGAIVGANSVVTRNIPANSIAVGVPAQVIKVFKEELGTWIGVKKDG
ncbi:DapH/DapD/GlmU-related protein [Deinococcus hopiensis]|uniref:Lipopolysaccharide O-acetyltransferase n=1 Tax=Deinococcus hopiensis KR-140 TaxID=695939 RepID=A0A1W1VB10_9DEIO|nr:DapH/DapD/GlmU-related protein [Deinococcus hopiensis]SMB90164.1 lipopolysaccharide O-acetyltransferase [Deinococcus hopiensis KR-140]